MNRDSEQRVWQHLVEVFLNGRDPSATATVTTLMCVGIRSSHPSQIDHDVELDCSGSRESRHTWMGSV